MFRFLLIITALCCVFARADAQVGGQENNSEFITKFGFRQLTGGVILIRGTFNDLPDSLNFILDTGSGAISLDSSTASEFKIPNEPSGYTVSGIAGKKEVNFAKGNTLNLPGLAVDSLDFFINDYEILSSVYGIKIDGVVGYSFLSRYIVGINYDDMSISVYTRGAFDYERGSHILRPRFTGLPILRTLVGDARRIHPNLYLDTGAGLSLLLTRQFVEDSAILRKSRKFTPMLVQGLGGKKGLEVTIVDRVRIGPFLFRKVPTNILRDDHNALSYPSVGGLIGNDIMRRFNVVLNYAAREIAIKPNTHFRDLFDYSYTGLNLYLLPTGEIVIDDIVEGSPAEKAGLKNGDLLIAVDKNFSNNISIYRDLFQNTGSRLRLLISRNDALQIFVLKVGRIY